VVPRAEKAVEQGFTDGLADFLLHDIGDVLDTKFRLVLARKQYDENDVDAARAYNSAMLEFILFSHRLYEFVHGGEVHGVAAGRHEHDVRREKAA